MGGNLLSDERTPAENLQIAAETGLIIVRGAIVQIRTILEGLEAWESVISEELNKGEGAKATKTFSVRATGDDTVLTLREEGKEDLTMILPANAPAGLLAWFNALKRVLHDKYGEPIYDTTEHGASTE